MGGNLAKTAKKEDNQPLHDELYSNTVTTIQTVWASLEKCPEKQLETGFKIYKRLFAKHPQYRNLFRDDLEQLVKRIIMMVSTVVEGLDDMEDLKKRIFQLGKRHAKYGVPEEAFEHFVEAILWGLKTCLGDAFTPRAEFCYRTMFTWASQTMIVAGRGKRKSFKKYKSYEISEFPELQDFDMFLEHPLCLEFFHLYLSQTFSEESILFYLDVLKFKNTEAPLSEMDETIKNLAQELFEQYIHEDGETPVNIPFTISEEIQKQMENPTPDMYDMCVKEIEGLLHRSKWLPFLESDTCQALCACLSGDVEVPDSGSLALMTEIS